MDCVKGQALPPPPPPPPTPTQNVADGRAATPIEVTAHSGTLASHRGTEMSVGGQCMRGNARLP